MVYKTLNIHVLGGISLAKSYGAFYVRAPEDRLQTIINQLKYSNEVLVKDISIYSDEEIGIITLDPIKVKRSFEDLYDFISEQTRRLNNIIWDDDAPFDNFCWSVPYEPPLLQAHEFAAGTGGDS